jgi:hypothetical protein
MQIHHTYKYHWFKLHVALPISTTPYGPSWLLSSATNTLETSPTSHVLAVLSGRLDVDLARGVRVPEEAAGQDRHRVLHVVHVRHRRARRGRVDECRESGVTDLHAVSADACTHAQL